MTPDEEPPAEEWHLGEPDSDDERMRRALGVLDDGGGGVDLAGYHLLSVEDSYGLWLVYDEASEDADLVDALQVNRFKSARQLLQYLHQLDNGHATTEGDVTAPEVA